MMKTQLTLSLIALASLASPAIAATPVTPDFGPNVLIFSPKTPSADIQQQIDKVYATQHRNEFGPERNAILFLPGNYTVDVPIGFYTQVLGLGSSPDEVQITGNVHSDAASRNNNATTTFWRAAENFCVVPTGGVMKWAVSQAAPFRRMHVQGDIVLHQNGGWASGGWFSDTLIDGNVAAGPQQQWISRNSEWHSWTGANWNMVFVGVPNPPEGEWPKPPYTKIAADSHRPRKTLPAGRRLRQLQRPRPGAFAPTAPESPGTPQRRPEKPSPSASFYIAHATRDNASTINAQLAHGKHLILTPGIYDLTEPIRVTKPNTVVMGLGFATLHPVNGTAAMTTADADGIIIAGLLFDAGPTSSPVLLQIGPSKSKSSHEKNPISLHDVFFRVGGAGVGRAVINLEINSNDTIVDHTWIWRADHGANVGWDANPSQNGLVVNGNNVTIYGLFVEHHQQFQVLWNGNGGRTYFYQSEIPYDPPDQASFTSAPGINGWASYKVADTVTSHEAWGLGIYSVFRHPDVNLTRAIEVPVNPNVRFHDMITVALDDKGEISNVINNTGGPTALAPHRVTPRVTNFP